MLMRVFLGWLRGERGHCTMVAMPTIDEKDAKRPRRERQSLSLKSEGVHFPRPSEGKKTTVFAPRPDCFVVQPIPRSRKARARGSSQ